MDDQIIFVAVGRFNPPTVGHEKLLYLIHELSRNKCDHIVFTSKNHDTKKNPLPFEVKIKYLKKAFPYINFSEDTETRTPFDCFKKLSDEGYKRIFLVMGGDRVNEFDQKIRKMMNHPDSNERYFFNELNVINAGERIIDSDDIEGVSGTRMRQYVLDDDFESFSASTPYNLDDDDVKNIFDIIKSYMS